VVLMTQRQRRVHPRRVAFTLIEAVVVFALIALLGGGAYLALSGQESPGGDVAARAGLVQLERLQTTRGDGPLSDTSVLGDLDPTRTWSSGESDGTSVVSVVTDPDDAALIGAAVSNGTGGCWLLRRDFDAATLAEATIWAVAEDGTCSGTRALTLELDPDDDAGTTVDRPIQL
jgi:type II secretory pathway pseudopilin PulG